MMNTTDEHHLRHLLVSYGEALSAGNLKGHLQLLRCSFPPIVG